VALAATSATTVSAKARFAVSYANVPTVAA